MQQVTSFFKSNRRLIMKKAISNTGVTFTFDGGLDAVTFDATKASEANRNYAVAFGFSHRIGDHAAISRNQGGIVVNVTEAMRRDAVLEMVAHLESGTEAWDMSKTARGPVQNPVFVAIAAKLGISYEAAMAKVQEQFLAELE